MSVQEVETFKATLGDLPRGRYRWVDDRGWVDADHGVVYLEETIRPIGGVFADLYFRDPVGFERYAYALETKWRWRSGMQPMKPFPGENLRNHTGTMLGLGLRLAQGFGYLFDYIDGDMMLAEVLFHDGGELATGDIAQTDERVMMLSRSEDTMRRHKQSKSEAEIQGFIDVVLPMFKPELRDEILEIFLRYEHRDKTNDLTAHFVKWLDIMAGSWVALEYFTPERTEENVENVKKLTVESYLRQTDLIRVELHRRLDLSWSAEGDDRRVWLNFQHFAKHHLDRIVGFGYGQEVADYWSEYEDLLGDLAWMMDDEHWWEVEAKL